MTDDDDDRAYPTVLHSPAVLWAGVACGLFWVVLVVWQDRADDRRQVVARLLLWRWLRETGRVS